MASLVARLSEILDELNIYEISETSITAYLAKFAEGTGKSVATVSNAKYEGAGDYLIITADFSADTEKAGTVKGKFLQIWKKEGDRHLVFHDEFEITA
ncbi:hypothetical protein CRE_29012 [Caenorhabditis remanei]|uniref:DUF4440 domain-containing protein n=1 Tax=Caenorhabditis remanei TaxID=31234 RepID=E3NA38_CAERE|nr:hypothetical protein CRE_29012 [Caenorhabditis remanei]